VITVVGAGIAGLSAAVLSARAGHAVRVVDRAKEPGGLAARHLFRGVPCDLGSHRLHAESLEVPLLAEMQDACAIRKRPRRGVVRLGGRFVPYPPSALGLMRGFGAVRAVSFAASLVRTRARLEWDRERLTGEDVGFEEFVRTRAGSAAYEEFYRPYAEKVWGVHPSELSQTVAKSRLSTSTPVAALASLFKSPSREFLYPERGISSLVDHLLVELERRGVVLELDTEFDPSRHGERIVLHSGNLGSDAVGLDHRGLYLVYMALPVARLRPFETYYVPEARYCFGRVADLRNYSPSLGRPGETLLVLEIPEGRLGTTLCFDRGPRLDQVLDQLYDADIVPRGMQPIEVEQRFVPGVYPLYRRGWLAAWRAAIERTAAAGNVFPFGRQGLYLHCNIHHCMQMATDVVDHLERGGTARGWIDRVDAYRGLRAVD
jgi:UDP-galactopyranose mutase